MQTDPTAYILAAAILGAIIGFFGCALYASNLIKRANLEGYKEGLRASQSPSSTDHIKSAGF